MAAPRIRCSGQTDGAAPRSASRRKERPDHLMVRAISLRGCVNEQLRTSRFVSPSATKNDKLDLGSATMIVIRCGGITTQQLNGARAKGRRSFSDISGASQATIAGGACEMSAVASGLRFLWACVVADWHARRGPRRARLFGGKQVARHMNVKDRGAEKGRPPAWRLESRRPQG